MSKLWKLGLCLIDFNDDILCKLPHMQATSAEAARVSRVI